MIKKINPRSELISFMRGFFVCPIISFLHRHKLIDKIIKQDFNSQTFKSIKNKENSGLRELNLRRNHIGDKGAKSISNLLKNIQMLKQ